MSNDIFTLEKLRISQALRTENRDAESAKFHEHAL